MTATILWLTAAMVLGLLHTGAAARAAAVLCACIAGTTLPDLDLVPLVPLIHRSALTHAVLPALLPLARRRWWPVAAGLATGIGFHLAADCFPNGMVGYATVKLPFAGSIGARASYWWLAANALAATLLGATVLAASVPKRHAVALLLAMAVTGIAYLFVTDGGWPALAIYGTLGWLAVRRRKSVPTA